MLFYWISFIFGAFKLIEIKKRICIPRSVYHKLMCVTEILTFTRGDTVAFPQYISSNYIFCTDWHMGI